MRSLWLAQRLGDHRYVHERINRRAKDHDAIAEWSGRSLMPVVTWQRDCDCAEWTQINWIKSTYEAYVGHQEGMYADAEGPVSMHIASPKEAWAFKPASRDRILEAFENGEYYHV